MAVPRGNLQFVKIWLTKTKIGGVTDPIIYPPIFDDKTLKGVPSLYQDTGKEGKDIREFLAGFIVPGTSQERIDEILNDPDIDLMTEEEVNQLGKELFPRRLDVNDPTACILAIAEDPGSRTSESLKVLDPNDPTPGIITVPEYDVRDQISAYFQMALDLET